MKLFIEREYLNEVTISDITVRDGSSVLYRCKGLELPWKDNRRLVSCIPEGSYKTIKRKSARFDEHFHLQDVPARDCILIHHGNFASGAQIDTSGCVLVGKSIKDINSDKIVDITSSKLTMDELNKILPDEFVTIVYKKGEDPAKYIF